MWNSTTLIPPPINSFRAKSSLIDINAVLTILENAINELKLQQNVKVESALLSRCVYRMNLKFRNDKGFKLMSKTNKVLKQAMNFDLTSDLKFFLDSMPRKYKVDMYLPTKQMLEYVLVRMQGFSKVLSRVVESAELTSKYMHYRLSLGHFWTTAAVVLSILSRIWKINVYFVKKCCSWYNELFPLREKLELTGLQWLSDNHTFPTDLTEWLDVHWLHDKPEISSSFQIDLPIFNLLDESDDEDVQFCYQYNLNDCYVIDDDSIMNDSDVQLIEPDNNNKIISNDVKYISDTDQSSDVEVLDSITIGDSVCMIDDDDVDDDNVEETVSQDNKCTNPIEEINLLSTTSMSQDSDDDLGEPVSRNEIITVDSTPSIDSVQIKTSSSSKKKRKKKKALLNSDDDTNSDLGEPVSRNEIITVDSTPSIDSVQTNTSSSSSSKKKRKKKKALLNSNDDTTNETKFSKIELPVEKQSLANIKLVDDLKEFLEKESSYRKRNLNKCVTKNITEEKWDTMHNYLLLTVSNAEKKPKKRVLLLNKARTYLIKKCKQ